MDEYLQATLIDLAGDHVSLNMRLAPGVEVFAQVLAKIDRDGNGAISSAEQQAYAESVGKDLFVSIDGQHVPLRLCAFTFPELQEMKQGLGEIMLSLEHKHLRAVSSARSFSRNHHLPEISIYLANCLVPSDPDIRVVAQNRNVTQSVYRLDYTLGDVHLKNLPVASASILTSWLASTGSESLFKAFFYQGIRHILTGYDHLLFVTALVLAATTLWDLIKVVSAFTLAHTITLTLTALNLIRLPETVVEPLIAASIVFVAIQNVFWRTPSQGLESLGRSLLLRPVSRAWLCWRTAGCHARDAERNDVFWQFWHSASESRLGIRWWCCHYSLPSRLSATHNPMLSRGTHLLMMIQRVGSAGISVAGIYYLCVAFACRS